MKRHIFIEYSKTIVCILFITVVTATFGIVQAFLERNFTLVSSDSVDDKVTIVIDAGHGGEDGGAVGTNGTLEKTINLEIAYALYDIFTLTDVDVVLTRDDDSLLYTSGQENRKKFYDLKNRVELCTSNENPIFVSIHQNKFPISKYKGLQVYYSPNNENSSLLAELIQNNTSEFLQIDNKRKTKMAGRNIYVLDKLDCPAVLVECGFLSNPVDEANLINPEYQKELAFVMFSSIMSCVMCET